MTTPIHPDEDPMNVRSVVEPRMRTGTEESIDTSNDSFVSLQGDKIVFIMPPLKPMPHAKALRLAAWIVAIVGDKQRFDEVFDAVKNT